jgi:hypothetical protein
MRVARFEASAFIRGRKALEPVPLRGANRNSATNGAANRAGSADPRAGPDRRNSLPRRSCQTT